MEIKRQMTDEEKLIQLHRDFKNYGFGEYLVQIREQSGKVLVTIKAGKIYQFFVEKQIED